MTAAENRFYWGRWAPCRAALVLAGVRRVAEQDAKRHEIHIAALGADKSHHDLDGLEHARVVVAFRAFARAHRPRSTTTSTLILSSEPQRRRLTTIQK